MMDLTSFMEDDIPSKDAKGTYPISKVAANEWKDFALYTVESRAIPSMIDSLKPVQRFYLYSSIVNSPSDFRKVSAIAGVVSDYGYNHGETSASSAGQLMAAEWANNVCLVEGRGSFGTRQVQVAGSARYVYTRLHKNFHKYIKDLDLAPKHKDPEHEPPAFYIPIIPLVLVNGIKGIATGFSTNILPRDPVDVKNACLEYIKTGKITFRPKVKFPDFRGVTRYNEAENRYYCEGTFVRKGKTVIIITEIPYTYDHASYVSILNDLEEKGDIVSYQDQCDKEGFKFEVKLKLQNANDWSDQKIMSSFKLIKPFTENLTVIDQNGNLKEYADERDLIKDFCDYRETILQKRIELRKDEGVELLRILKVKREFIRAVLDEKIKFKDKKKIDVSKDIMKFTSAITDDVDVLLRMNIMSLTDEMIKQLEKQIENAEKLLSFWNETTTKKQFVSDLGEI